MNSFWLTERSGKPTLAPPVMLGVAIALAPTHAEAKIKFLHVFILCQRRGIATQLDVHFYIPEGPGTKHPPHPIHRTLATFMDGAIRNLPLSEWPLRMAPRLCLQDPVAAFTSAIVNCRDCNFPVGAGSHAGIVIDSAQMELARDMMGAPLHHKMDEEGGSYCDDDRP